MENAELALFPPPFAGHQTPMVEFAKVLASRDHRISVTVFILNLPFRLNTDPYTRALHSNPPPPRVRFVDLPLDDSTREYLLSKPFGQLMRELAQIHKQRVKDLLLSSESTRRLAGFIVDMFCTSFMDVAVELGVPSHVFFTCNAGALSLLLHLQSLQDDENRDISEFKGSDAELRVPGIVNPVPAKVLPERTVDKDDGGSNLFADATRKLRKAKGILVNTCTELEPHIIHSLLDNHTIPQAYAVGPILNLKAKTDNDGSDLDQHEATMMWLDNQPPASVVFLCFGSAGAFRAEQVAEIAHALEHGGHRFLWSLRRPPAPNKLGLPTDYEDPNDVLPEGFLDRTREIGKVIGWAPQVAVLSHSAVGGFVSHCGWNSILESLWHGVPVATWPIYAEQQMNAFEMVKELGLAVEIKLDYRRMEENQVIVTEEEIGRGIKQLMEDSESTQIRKKVKAMMEEIRMAVVEGGSSYGNVGLFIQKVINGSP